MERTFGTWQDGVNFLLGVALFLSPFVLGFSTERAPSFNAHIIGALIAILALATILAFQAWEEWINAVLGLWLIVAPWVLGFNGHEAAKLTHVLIGVATLVLAVWAVRDHETGHLPVG
ncbi:SPW repeat protein [Hyphomicrobium sp. LHD-15]|uniref:SPW repeat protein n=1 Tax=Hyphomicrobium sp. LHD-15 TaxID=3072142 RepID=UPI0028105EBA|nr:SPW repeat protein [Hyphomicrobium sp. LHD-15]MDQ8699407.1 SPW repeat protein [Hyphomicrobium sp. LHD-15]